MCPTMCASALMLGCAVGIGTLSPQWSALPLHPPILHAVILHAPILRALILHAVVLHTAFSNSACSNSACSDYACTHSACRHFACSHSACSHSACISSACSDFACSTLHFADTIWRCNTDYESPAFSTADRYTLRVYVHYGRLLLLYSGFTAQIVHWIHSCQQ